MNPSTNHPCIEKVHFQLTKYCNLHCWFCGQWGNRGGFPFCSGTPMTENDWCSVINELVHYRENHNTNIDVTLWGGEPLLYPAFDKIAYRLHQEDFTLRLVTNGTLIDKHTDCLNENFEEIYLSIDGPKPIHDSIRGTGVYEKVRNNLALLKTGNAKITLMSVITRQLIQDPTNIITILQELQPDQLLLQDMIALTDYEISNYKHWLKKEFHIEASHIDSWISSDTEPVSSQEISQCLENLTNYPVVHLAHGTKKGHCLCPFTHPHITWNGNVIYCTDFYDCSVGNIKDTPLEKIFCNSSSQHFRQQIMQHKCITCQHCSWNNNTDI